MKYFLCVRPLTWCTAYIAIFNNQKTLQGRCIHYLYFIEERTKPWQRLYKLPDINELVCSSGKKPLGWSFNVLIHNSLSLSSASPRTWVKSVWSRNPAPKCAELMSTCKQSQFPNLLFLPSTMKITIFTLRILPWN